MQKLILFFFCFISINSYAAAYLKVLYIADHDIVCGNKTCLLTREAPADEYQIFDKAIEGFTYEAGYEYCILVEIQTPGLTDTLTASDALKPRIVLSEIRSKTKIQHNDSVAIRHSNIALPDSSKWMLYKLRMKDGSTKTFSLQKAYLQFDTINNTVIGNTECNSFKGSFTADASSLKFDNIISTMMACGKHSIEPVFLNMIHSVTEYKLTSKLLYLYKGKTLVGLFTRKK